MGGLPNGKGRKAWELMGNIFLNWARELKHIVRDFRDLERSFSEITTQVQKLDEHGQGLETQLQGAEKRLQGAEKRLQGVDEQLEEILQSRHEVPAVLVNEGVLGHAPYLTASCRKDTSEKDAFYYNIAEVFRGSEEHIYQGLKMFVPYVVPAALKHPDKFFLDFGCGRGEFLDLLRENNVMARGVDLNEEVCQLAKDRGHDVVVGDAIAYLEEQEEESLSGISLIMVSEHLPFPVLYDSIFLFSKKITLGGALFINTINPYCYKRWGNFQLDPSHITFLPPDIYRLIFEMAGFTDVKVIWSAPVDTLVEREGLHTAYENVSIVGYKADMELQEER